MTTFPFPLFLFLLPSLPPSLPPAPFLLSFFSFFALLLERERKGGRGMTWCLPTMLPTMLGTAFSQAPTPPSFCLPLQVMEFADPGHLAAYAWCGQGRQSQCTSGFFLVTKKLSFYTSSWFSNFHGLPSFTEKIGPIICFFILPQVTGYTN